MSASVSQIIIATTRSVHPAAGCQNGRRKMRTHFPDNVLEGNITISLLMNITMNQLGGASVIAKFHS